MNKKIEEMAKDILEEYSYAYSEVDLEQLAKKLQAMKKETAREILQEVNALIKNCLKELDYLFEKNNQYKKGYENSAIHFGNNIKEIAKKYGVEVE